MNIRLLLLQAKATPTELEALKIEYILLKLQEKLNLVDLHDAQHGGGFKSLRMARYEQEDIETELLIAEQLFEQFDVQPDEGFPSEHCTPQEAEKLSRYYEIYMPITAVELPELGGDFVW